VCRIDKLPYLNLKVGDDGGLDEVVQELSVRGITDKPTPEVMRDSQTGTR